MGAQFILARSVALLEFTLVLTGLSWNTAAMEKMKIAELVEKHLAAIGTSEARAAIRDRFAKGTATASITPPEIRNAVFVPHKGQSPSEIRTSKGNAVLVSEGKSVRLDLHFSEPNSELNLELLNGELKAGILGQMPGFREVLKKGLIGGILTTSWVMFDAAGAGSRLKYKGLKKRNGEDFHELQCTDQKALGNLRVLIYFDPLTFRHVLTEYRYVQGPYRFSRGAGYGTTDTLMEEFADFSVVDGITLPHTYRLRHTRNVNSHLTVTEWSVAFEEIRHNRQLDANAFLLK